MRSFIILVIALFSLGSKAQYYPNPLPSSGELRMSWVISWMNSAGELAGSSPPYSMLFLKNRSHLDGDDTALSRWYGYAIGYSSYSGRGGKLNGDGNYVFNCLDIAGQPEKTIYYSGSLTVDNFVYENPQLTIPYSARFFRSHDGAVNLNVLSTGKIFNTNTICQ